VEPILVDGMKKQFVWTRCSFLSPVGKSSHAEVSPKPLRSVDTGYQFKPTKSLLQVEGE